MKKFLIGRSPLTSIVGYLLAVVMGVHQAAAAGAHNWQDFLLPASIALLGRLSSDDSNKRPPLPPLPAPLPAQPVIPPSLSTAFQRRGREHRQKRSHNGRFAAALA